MCFVKLYLNRVDTAKKGARRLMARRAEISKQSGEFFRLKKMDGVNRRVFARRGVESETKVEISTFCTRKQPDARHKNCFMEAAGAGKNSLAPPPPNAFCNVKVRPAPERRFELSIRRSANRPDDIIRRKEGGIFQEFLIIKRNEIFVQECKNK